MGKMANYQDYAKIAKEIEDIEPEEAFILIKKHIDEMDNKNRK